jgi:hypothetical protein
MEHNDCCVTPQSKITIIIVDATRHRVTRRIKTNKLHILLFQYNAYVSATKTQIISISQCDARNK